MKNERKTPENESGLEKGQVQCSKVSGPLSGRACGLFLIKAVLLLSLVRKGFLFLCQMAS